MNERECSRKRRDRSPSFAGITLIRFYGYDLSPAQAGHPGNLVAQNYGGKFLKHVTFMSPPS